MKCTRDRGNESMNLLLDCTTSPKVKWGRNEHRFNKSMVRTWSMCISGLYSHTSWFLSSSCIYKVLFVYYVIIYTCTGCSFCICVGTVLCFVCCCNPWVHVHVCSIYENFRTSIWCDQWYSIRDLVVLWSKSCISVSRVSIFQLDKCTCVPRVNAPTVVKSPSYLHVSVSVY